MMYLLDTNIFLEILLNQANESNCRIFLSQGPGPLFISDFSLHSIGVILFRKNLHRDFSSFAEDLLNNLDVLSLPDSLYARLDQFKSQFGLDFDDAYQFALAKFYGMELVTQDLHFKSVQSEITVKFL